MNEKIQLKHPAQKKAVSMDIEKYEVLKIAILNCLKSGRELSHTELLKSVTENLKKNKIKFEGSVEWHMEWVKLNLEAEKEIKRMQNSNPVKFALH